MTLEELKQFKQDYLFFNGFLSADPEMKYFDSGACKVIFSLPLKKNKEDKTTWLNCECWNKKAEEIGEKYKKGDEITVGGILKENTYNEKTYINLIVKVVG